MPVTSGIISTALHPPLGLLTNHLDANGPYGAGIHTLTDWNDGGVVKPVADTFGVLAIVNGAVPLKFTYRFGWVPAEIFDGNEYEQRLLQIVVQHQLLLGLGGWVTTDLVDQHAVAQLTLWEEALPGRIGLYVTNGLSFDLQFLLAL